MRFWGTETIATRKQAVSARMDCHMRKNAFEANPHRRRAQLVVLTDKGKQTFDAAMRLQAPWINSLSEGIAVKDIQTVQRVIMALREKLESNETERA